MAKIGSISERQRYKGEEQRACGQLATNVATADATSNRQERGTWEKVLQGNFQVQVEGNHPAHPEREGWSQLGRVVLSCSWLVGGHACSPQVCPVWAGLLGGLLEKAPEQPFAS